MEENKAELIYFTDPLCCFSYIFEPILEVFLDQHRQEIIFSFHMGGMVPNSQSFFDPDNDIFEAKDVAKYWERFSALYHVPISIDMWINDPMESSYLPSIAIKAAQRQNNEKGFQYLRAIRKMIFVDGLNAEREENLLAAAKECQLDIEQFLFDMRHKAVDDFLDDLRKVDTLGIQFFPTIQYKKGNEVKWLDGYISQMRREDLDKLL